MAITTGTATPKPPTLQYAVWQKQSEQAEIVAWCGGRIVDANTIRVPDIYGQADDGWNVSWPCALIKNPDGSFVPVYSVTEFNASYTRVT